MRWQNAAFLQDRLDARGFADTLYTEPAQILRLGEDHTEMFIPWLDEMVSLSIDRNFVRDYLRMQALWFQIAYVIAPHLRVSPVRISTSQRAHMRPTLPRDRRFVQLRAEIRAAATMLRCLLKSSAMERTLSPLALAVLLALTSSGVGGVLGGPLGSVTTSKSSSRCGASVPRMPILA